MEGETPEIPFEEDPANALRDDAARAIAWRADDREVIEVYVDPALRDREDEICDTIEAIAAAHKDVDGLSRAIETFGDAEDLSISIYDEPPNVVEGLVAVAVTLG